MSDTCGLVIRCRARDEHFVIEELGEPKQCYGIDSHMWMEFDEAWYYGTQTELEALAKKGMPFTAKSYAGEECVKYLFAACDGVMVKIQANNGHPVLEVSAHPVTGFPVLAQDEFRAFMSYSEMLIKANQALKE